MVLENENIETSSKTKSINDFIDEIKHTLETHKILNETNTLNEEILKIYTDLSSGNIENLLDTNKNAAIEYYEKKLILDYFQGLINLKLFPTNLAINSNGTGIMIWAEVETEEEEYNLYRLEGKLNLVYGAKGIKLDTTVVEKSDNYTIPSHYKKLQISKL